jgi:hypothetical protein
MVDRPQYDEDTAAALRDARQRFSETFHGRVASMRALADTIGPAPLAGAVESLRHEAHRLAGFAGMIGFRAISEKTRADRRCGHQRCSSLGTSAPTVSASKGLTM